MIHFFLLSVVELAHKGPCKDIDNCHKDGTAHYGLNPVCANNGLTYVNAAEVKCLQQNNTGTCSTRKHVKYHEKKHINNKHFIFYFCRFKNIVRRRVQSEPHPSAIRHQRPSNLSFGAHPLRVESSLRLRQRNLSKSVRFPLLSSKWVRISSVARLISITRSLECLLVRQLGVN